MHLLLYSHGLLKFLIYLHDFVVLQSISCYLLSSIKVLRLTALISSNRQYISILVHYYYYTLELQFVKIRQTKRCLSYVYTPQTLAAGWLCIACLNAEVVAKLSKTNDSDILF